VGTVTVRGYQEIGRGKQRRRQGARPSFFLSQVLFPSFLPSFLPSFFPKTSFSFLPSFLLASSSEVDDLFSGFETLVTI
jgi:hypothetical protein